MSQCDCEPCRKERIGRSANRDIAALMTAVKDLIKEHEPCDGSCGVERTNPVWTTHLDWCAICRAREVLADIEAVEPA